MHRIAWTAIYGIGLVLSLSHPAWSQNPFSFHQTCTWPIHWLHTEGIESGAPDSVIELKKMPNLLTYCAIAPFLGCFFPEFLQTGMMNAPTRLPQIIQD